ncbi:Transthyretin-like family protein [Caenorhabditis elegans]|uniref:Transthyretin-like family protein n=1 Tax=Caenorhabditis elegans TaxID=6239 RepID=Q9XXR5_CAEEL|nr:Transthyretin-like family protein [Caenorhabditis elegans]CAA16398.1 Transthyretin-like family protein [Caenorhabditis elegans]|eukprot:NP_507630.1 TransThyretin-Related family domain [Caenorhabditis elegans]
MISAQLFAIFSVLVISTDGLLGIIGSKQGVTVTGKLICNGQPASNVLVKMYEDGTFYDSKMGSVKTGSDGTFRVSGDQNKIRTIDPKVNIYHKCNYNGLCSKKVSINIPKNAVVSGSGQNARNYDIGTINLANKFSGESTDCIH